MSRQPTILVRKYSYLQLSHMLLGIILVGRPQEWEGEMERGKMIVYTGKGRYHSPFLKTESIIGTGV